GQFSPSFNWSNQPQPDFTDPFGPLTPAQIPQAVGNLLGVAPGKGLIVNEKDDSWFFIANVSQYLFLTDDPASVPEKLKLDRCSMASGSSVASASRRRRPIRLRAMRASHCLRMASRAENTTALVLAFSIMRSAAT